MVVYADQAAQHVIKRFDEVSVQDGIPDWDFEGTTAAEEMSLITQTKREMQQTMSNYVGIVRSNLRLERAMRRLDTVWHETEELYQKTKPNRDLGELRNMITVSYLIIKQAQQLKESVGLHYNMDYPQKETKI